VSRTHTQLVRGLHGQILGLANMLTGKIVNFEAMRRKEDYAFAGNIVTFFTTLSLATQIL
jgi:hypothetical protein